MQTIVLNKFIIKIYPFKDGPPIDPISLNEIMPQLSLADTPKQLCEILLSINGVSKIKIYDKNKKLLCLTEISNNEEDE
jgi:hypothetical protein